MNLIELNRSLQQLRLGGITAVLETRLLQAQAENMAHIDLLSTLVSDELECRSKRLLERRHKQAQFRDADKRLDNFDFQFNPKMNRKRPSFPSGVTTGPMATMFSWLMSRKLEQGFAVAGTGRCWRSGGLRS